MTTHTRLLHTAVTLLTAAALTLCAGCGQRPAETPGDKSSPSTSTPASSDPSSAEALTQLSCFSATSVPQMALLEDDRLITCWSEYSDVMNEDESYDSTTHLSVIDLKRDTVLQSIDTDVDYSLLRSFSTGDSLLLSYLDDGAHYYRCTPELEITDLNLPAESGCFSPDGSSFYYVEGEKLYRNDLTSGVVEPVALEYDLRFNYLNEIQLDGSLLSCSVYPSFYASDTCSAIVDVDTGKLVLLQNDYLNLSFAPGECHTMGYDYETESYRIGRLPTDSATLTYYALPVDEESMRNYYEMISIPNSDYMISSYDSNAADGEAWMEAEESEPLEPDPHVTLYRIADDALESCSLTDCGLPGQSYSAQVLDDGTLVCSNYLNDSCTLYIVNPSALTFQRQTLTEDSSTSAVDQELLSQFLAELESPLLAEDLSGVRAQADAMEDKYGVSILLSNTCAPACDASGYQVVTSDQAGWSNEAATISRALNQLDEALSVYPEGFFSQFRTSTQNSGMYFLMAGPISSEDGPDNIAAFQYTMRDNYYVCVDMTNYDLIGTFYHELWHAIECKLSNDNADSAFYTDWDDCNPPDFSYDYSFDDYDAGTHSGEWTLLIDPDNAYFVDDYSRTFPAEDRARIMETIMGDDYYAQLLMEREPMRAKLRLMCDAIRADFDTTGWSTPVWEKYF